MDGLIGGVRRNDPELLTFHKTAIFFSAIVLTTAITSLMFATHPAIRSIGLVTLIGLSSTGLIAYAVLPYLFRWLTKK